MIVDLEEPALERAAASLGGDGVAWQAADVTDSDQVRGAVEATVDQFGGLDIAFANAGVFGVVAPLTEYPGRRVRARDGGQRHRQLSRRQARAQGDETPWEPDHQLERRRPDLGYAAIGAYATSKHAVVGLMRTAAKEMAAKGIRVNSLHPGPTDNEFQHAIEVEAVGALARGIREGLRTDDPALAPRRAAGDRERRSCSSPATRARS